MLPSGLRLNAESSQRLVVFMNNYHVANEYSHSYKKKTYTQTIRQQYISIYIYFMYAVYTRFNKIGMQTNIQIP